MAKGETVTLYCVKCREKRNPVNPEIVTRGGRRWMRSKCPECATEMQCMLGAVKHRRTAITLMRCPQSGCSGVLNFGVNADGHFVGSCRVCEREWDFFPQLEEKMLAEAAAARGGA